MKVLKQERIYVQMQDIGYLNSTDMSIPASIYLKVFSGPVTVIGDHNRFDYVSFDDPKEIEFFESLTFIIDYNEYKDLTLEQISQKGTEVSNMANLIAKEYNEMSITERRNHTSMLELYNNLTYKMQSIAAFYCSKKDGIDIEPKLDQGPTKIKK